MRNNLILGVSFLLCLSLYVNDVRAQKSSNELVVEVAVPQWRPYIYKENGVVKGYAYKILKDVFNRAGVPFNFFIRPWARVYNDGLEKKNYLIPGIGRTPKREKLFNWVGPITKGDNNFIYKLKSNPITIKSIKDAKNYMVGTERGSYSHDLLVTNGLKKIYPVGTVEQLLQMLMLKRLTFFILDEERFLNEVEKLKLDPNLFEKALLAINVQEYMAFSKNTSPELVEKLRKAYQEIVKEGKIRTMLISTLEE